MVYLREPVTSKEIVDGGDLSNHGANFGVCEMQGWRRNMEDSHLAETELDKNVSLFGVFDGHGGRGVSKFAAANLAGILRETEAYQKGDYARALERAFLTIDEKLREPAGRKEIERLDKPEAGAVSHPMAVPRRVVDKFLGTNKKDDASNKTDSAAKPESDTVACDEVKEGQEPPTSGEKSEDAAESSNVSPELEQDEGDDADKENDPLSVAEDDETEVLIDDEDFEDGDDEEEMALVDPAQLTRDPTPEAQGCTAVVVLIVRKEGGNGSRIFCANAGDSRAIMSRKGVVLPLSEDHKPENDIETARINAAGGYVQHMPGGARVQGDLNLSRAMGDLRYKKPDDKPPEEQILTVFPEVRTFDLTDDDEFMVIGCDGIWERKQNQEMIDFVRPKICAKDESSQARLHSSICGEICDTGLCPSMDPGENESFDGTGCDNMTVMVVQLKKDAGGPAIKRPAEETTEAAEPVADGKRQKVDESSGST